MNGWVSLLFTIMGGVALFMKGKTEQKGGDFSVIKNNSENAPSESVQEDVDMTVTTGESSTSVPSDVTISDVINDPSLLNTLKLTDPEKYDQLTTYIWRSLDYLKQYVRDTKATTGEYVAPFASKEEEVLRLLQEGFSTEYVGRSLTGQYWVEIFTKKDDNIGWRGDEKVGIIIYEVLMNFPEQGMVRVRDYMLADEEFPDYDRYISQLNNKYITL